jgi:hypothetical protein
MPRPLFAWRLRDRGSSDMDLAPDVQRISRRRYRSPKRLRGRRESSFPTTPRAVRLPCPHGLHQTWARSAVRGVTRLPTPASADLTPRRYLAGSFRRTARSYRRPRSPSIEIQGGERGRPIGAAVRFLSVKARSLWENWVPRLSPPLRVRPNAPLWRREMRLAAIPTFRGKMP